MKNTRIALWQNRISFAQEAKLKQAPASFDPIGYLINLSGTAHDYVESIMISVVYVLSQR